MVKERNVLLVATPTAVSPPTAMTVGGTTNKETFENTFMTAAQSGQLSY